MRKVEALSKIIGTTNEETLFNIMEHHCPNEYGMENECITEEPFNEMGNCFRCWLGEKEDDN